VDRRHIEMAKTPEELYQEREKRFNDAIQVKVPDRVPIALFWHFFGAKYGGINCQEAMYDHDRLAETTRKAVVDFDLDGYVNPSYLVSVGPMMEMLGERRFKWPGHGVSVDSTYQYVEEEYMRADEYDAFIADPTDYILRTHIPRVLGALEPLKMLPYIPGVAHFFGLNTFLPAAFATPPIAQALEALARAGQESLKMISRTEAFDKEMAELGFPSLIGSYGWAPFDYIGDHFRGTTGIMLDMYERPDKLLAAIDKVTPAIINTAVGLVQQTGIPRCFIPLHKGLDGFMSPKQFDTFYWPTLKQVILALIDQNIVPLVIWEGDCTSRLETIADIPKGKAIYFFERTDMHRAKEVLGGQVCIMGLMPSWVLCTGSPQDVRDYCKRLIDVVGKGGGYILNGDVGIPDEAKPENVKAMVDFTKEYGVYK
jgi:uroporphyrinogen-III decarboxylase